MRNHLNNTPDSLTATRLGARIASEFSDEFLAALPPWRTHEDLGRMAVHDMTYGRFWGRSYIEPDGTVTLHREIAPRHARSGDFEVFSFTMNFVDAPGLVNQIREIFRDFGLRPLRECHHFEGAAR